MAKLILNALLRRRREGVQAKVAEFPDIKVSALSIGTALYRLRGALWQRLRWTKVENKLRWRTYFTGTPEANERRFDRAN